MALPSTCFALTCGNCSGISGGFEQGIGLGLGFAVGLAAFERRNRRGA